MRAILRQYRDDKGTFPGSLKDLVDEGYVRAIPHDPMTRSRDTWKVTYGYAGTPAPGSSSRLVIVNVRSGSPDRAADGTPYSAW